MAVGGQTISRRAIAIHTVRLLGDLGDAHSFILTATSATGHRPSFVPISSINQLSATSWGGMVVAILGRLTDPFLLQAEHRWAASEDIKALG